MEFYEGTACNSKNNYKKIINTIFIFIISILISFVFVFITKIFYLDLPDVYFSISKDKVVAVMSADGKKLPLNPLPEKYKPIIYVK